MCDRTPQKSLGAFRESASLALENLSPGEIPSAPTVIPTRRPSPYTFNFTNTDNNNKPIRNVGAIVGGVLGGVIFLVILATTVVFLVMRKKSNEEGYNNRGVGIGGYVIGWPDMVKSSNYGVEVSATV
ncbi:hypothetical protein C7212DRAFT_302054 [Tuber magnatum]|uniref:Uncharacterized protein n=1 Tax=Tuber magnatum TaxID=42249 RepID=A0A317SE67_9PEZI|nr:hypothetical protein C7212DRAFT_302054 [Tuber magnatum]